jgi:hypothetical protein
VSWVLIPALVVLAAGTAVAVSRSRPLPTLVMERGKPSPRLEQTVFRVDGVSCRRSAQAFATLLLQRNDEYALRGYLRVECYAGLDAGTAVVAFDPEEASAAAVRNAFMQPMVNWEDLTTQPTGFREVR